MTTIFDGCFLHAGLSNCDMDTFRIQGFGCRLREQVFQNSHRRLYRFMLATDAKPTAAIAYRYTELLFDKTEVFVELAAKARETAIIRGFENEIPRCLVDAQCS